MKKLILLASTILFMMNTKAQTNTDEIVLLQAAYGMDKKQIVMQYMKFTEAENNTFWKEYDVYEAERKEIGKKRINNITEYAINYEKLSDENVKTLVHNSLSIQSDFTKLWEKTYAKMTKLFSPVRAAQWLQIEMYLENVVRLEIADAIPMIGELEKAHK